MDPRSQLQSTARDLLANPQKIPGFEGLYSLRWRMRLWHYPSLRGPWVSLFLYQGRHSPRSSPIEVPVCGVTWSRKEDTALARDADPSVPASVTPTVVARCWSIPREAFERRFSALQGLVFSPFSPSGVGTDGWTRGVEAKLGLGTTSIAWWGNPPAGFAPLVAWYDETWSEIHRSFSGSVKEEA